jgi:integrase
MAVKVREWKGAWWVFVDYQGRRKAKRVGAGARAKRAAEVAAETLQARLTLGDASVFNAPRPLSPAPVLTVAAYAQRWLVADVALRLKPASHETYEQIVRLHLTPGLGEIPLPALSRQHIREFLAARIRAGLGRARVQLMLAVLTACLNAAVDEELLAANPALRLGRYTKSNQSPVRPIEIFTPAEIEHLLRTAQQGWPEGYPLLLVMARTGLRLGEALALRVEDLDFERRDLWVRRSWGPGRRSYGEARIGSPKSRRMRRVDMSRQLADGLQNYLGLREADAILTGRPASGWLFPGPDGGPMTRNQFHPRWRRLLSRAGIRPRKAHTLRHTFASQLIQNGENLAYVRDQLGHHSIKLTVDVYGHLLPGDKTAVDRLDGPTIRNPAATAPSPPSPNPQLAGFSA